ncbi:MAG: hypothetical protein NVS2B16_03730 [Chloroflexota bacterium]
MPSGMGVLRYGLVIVTLLVSVFTVGSGAFADRQEQSPRPLKSHPTVVRRTIPRWVAYDRAAYAVSTLNLPLCDNRQQLSAFLHDRQGAASYTLLQSVRDPDVTFIQVRSASRSLVGVYAYRMGFALPEGVWQAHCVDSAPDSVVSLYRTDTLMWLARFASTNPGT